MNINETIGYPANLPIIVENELFLYPFMITPIFLEDTENIKALEYAIEHNKQILVVPSKTGDENGKFEKFYDAGVIGSIMRKSDLPDGRIKILFQGSSKGRILNLTDKSPLLGNVDTIFAIRPTPQKTEALLRVLREKVKALSGFSPNFQSDFVKTIEESVEPVRICDLICSALRFKKDIAYKFFIEENLEDRILKLIDYIGDEIESWKLQREIKTKVSSKIDNRNKEYFLKEQLKQIHRELGFDANKEVEIEEYRKKLDDKKPFMSNEAYKEIKKQIDKLARMQSDSAEASMTQGYIDWVIDIPFDKLSKAKMSLKDVSNQLNKDHHGLQKPKKRIEEYFGLRELLEKRGLDFGVNNGVILCFVGPPGVGKTSLANSIATALKRELVRVALGGLDDVNELRGHRRTYIGAMPGRIVQGLIEAKHMNPVIIFDEIDKVAKSHRGDPTAVLLEILDPEQNNKFRDYYLNFNIDLSKVIFIATANDISQIPMPLRDRMEFIHLNSYTPQEKFEIAKKYLIPQELKKHGLKGNEISISKESLSLVIEEYTRESGVRNLRRRIADILRKGAIEILTTGQKKVSVTPKNLPNFLEKKVFEIDKIDKIDKVGIVNGLAWTSVGGDVLKVEAIRIKGKGELKVTGQLGDVMKESSLLAFSVVKVLIDSGVIKIPKELQDDEKQIYNLYDIHLHVPEGATPKDGPSAGITMVCAIASILSNAPVKSDVAMTGEITLSGRVLPIGGLKEKLIAAYKAKINKVLIPKKNYDRDLDEIPDEVKDDMQIIAVETIQDVLKHTLK